MVNRRATLLQESDRWGATMRLFRDNTTDPRVAQDLELLAGEFGDDEARDRAAALAADAAPGDRPEVPGDETEAALQGVAGDPLEDPFVRTFVGAAIHLRRYGPFYLGALAWLAVLVLVPPVDRSGRTTDNFTANGFAASPAAVGSTSLAADATGVDVPIEPSGATFGEFSIGPMSSSATLDDFGDTVAFDSTADDGGRAPAFDDSPATFDDSAFPDSDERDAAAEDDASLSILASGYSSRTGGTPLEQDPPGGGLPVAATGGQDAKRSYVKLGGTGTVLRLKLVTDANQNINVETAAVKVCPITKADWQPARGQALDAGPPFNVDRCQAGVAKAGGVWEFDLEQFGPPAELPGFALTRAAGASGATFQVVFAPVALPPE